MMTPGRWATPLPARPAWLDMIGEPCWSTWSPRTCGGYDQRSPVDHRCHRPRAVPHVCTCHKGCRSPEDPAGVLGRRIGR